MSLAASSPSVSNHKQGVIVVTRPSFLFTVGDDLPTRWLTKRAGPKLRREIDPPRPGSSPTWGDPGEGDGGRPVLASALRSWSTGWGCAGVVACRSVVPTQSRTTTIASADSAHTDSVQPTRSGLAHLAHAAYRPTRDGRSPRRRRQPGFCDSTAERIGSPVYRPDGEKAESLDVAEDQGSSGSSATSRPIALIEGFQKGEPSPIIRRGHRRSDGLGWPQELDSCYRHARNAGAKAKTCRIPWGHIESLATTCIRSCPIRAPSSESSLDRRTQPPCPRPPG